MQHPPPHPPYTPDYCVMFIEDLCMSGTVTRLEPGVMEYWLTKYEMLTVHGTTKQLMDCRLHLLSLLPDTDVIYYMEIVRELVKVSVTFCPSCFH